MKKIINHRPSVYLRWVLGLTPFILLLIFYLSSSNARLAENPNDKLLPSLESMGQAMYRAAFQPSKRTGEFIFWKDTLSSLKRLLMGICISGLIALLIGISMGAIPYVHANLSPIITAISLIPPMAILPILFIIFGLGEISKVVLIVFGTAPFMTRDILQRVLEVPKEQLVKAQTLGANTWQIIIRIILPQIMPRLINTIRLSLGGAWLFLIAAEAIASTDGLGYRIFLVRRYLAMDMILPYVVWITILAFILDYVLKRLSALLYPWFTRLNPV